MAIQNIAKLEDLYSKTAFLIHPGFRPLFTTFFFCTFTNVPGGTFVRNPQNTTQYSSVSFSPLNVSLKDTSAGSKEKDFHLP